MYAGMMSEECIICGAVYYGGGILIRGRFICGDCERMMVNTGCDSLLYDFYVKGLKNIWCCTVT